MDLGDFKDLCKEVVEDPDLQPKDGETFCNMGLNQIASEFGFSEFDGKMANQCIQLMKGDARWEQVEADEAHEWANQGNLAVATYVEEPHGHVAVIYPGEKVNSGKWGLDVPQVANVGKHNGIFGENFAFKDPPVHYKYKGPASA